MRLLLNRGRSEARRRPRVHRPRMEMLEGRRLLSDGGFDLGFGDSGRVPFPMRSAPATASRVVENALAVATQPDGKVVVAGQTTTLDATTGQPVSTLAVGRLLPDGTPDPGFGSGGKVFVEGAGNVRLPHAGLVIQGDGKIYVACDSVVRLNSDGSLDASWGTGGRAVFPQAILGIDCEMQYDGKLIVLGSVNDRRQDSWVYRLNADGTRDTSFREGFDPGSWGNNPLFGFFNDLAVQANGQIAVAGYGGSGRKFALRLLNADGTPNPWNHEHAAIAFLAAGAYEYAAATSIAVQADGKLLLAGTVNDDLLGIMRINPDGSLDPSFDGDGKLLLPIDLGSNDFVDVRALAALVDGTILVAGTDQFTPNGPGLPRTMGLVLRFGPGGTLDPSFGSGGQVAFSFDASAPSQLDGASAPRFDSLEAMAIHSDGRIVGAGVWAPISGANDNSAFGVSRLTAGAAPVVITPQFTGSPSVPGGGVGGSGGGGVRPVEFPPVFLGTSRLTAGKGRKKKVVGFVLRFSAPLNAAEAQDVARYVVTQPGRGKRSAPKRVAVRSSRYNGVDHSVTLVLGKYDAKKALSLTAGGLVGIGGTPAPTVLAKL